MIYLKFIFIEKNEKKLNAYPKINFKTLLGIFILYSNCI